MRRLRKADDWREQLVPGYARLGVEEWQKTATGARRQAAAALGFEIADQAWVAEQAVTSPFSPQKSGQYRMIPMPRMPRRVSSAFFAPTVSLPADRTATAFDLVVVGPEERPIAFRFEPPDESPEARHGYDHVQLCEKVAHREVELKGAVTPLPVSYPAFPLPSHDPTTRFLAMVVALHGYPDGVEDVVDGALKGRVVMVKSCLDTVRGMLSANRPKPASA